MFNERFDKILKKNLEAVRPEYQPQAWERFRKKLPAAGLLPFLGSYGGWILASMMLAGWGTTIYTLKQNQDLIRQLSQTRRPAAVMPVDDVNKESDFNTQVRSRKDTVYVVRKTIVEHRHYNFPGNGEAQMALPAAQVAQSTALRKPDHYDGAAPARSDRSSERISENGRHSTAAPDTHLLADPQTPDAEQITVTGYQVMKADSFNRALDKEAVIALIDSAWAQQSGMKKAVLKEINASENAKDAEELAPERAGRTPFTLASLQPRFGISGTYSLYSYGLGPSFEIFPTENLGFSFGIHAATLKPENHKVLRDYNSATGKLFLVQYRNYLPARFDRIEDISIRTSVISIPVHFKYYIPLQPSLSLFIHTGTSFDVSAYQQVSFQSYLNQTKRRNTFEMDAEPHFFNDFMVGAGIQYRRSRIYAQLAPYYVYDFRNIVNTVHGSNFGVRGSLWLNLFK